MCKVLSNGKKRSVFFFNDTATTEIYTLSLHDALPISQTAPSPIGCGKGRPQTAHHGGAKNVIVARSEEHTSELQSRLHLVCRLLLEKKKSDVMTTGNHHSSTLPGRPQPLRGTKGKHIG